MSPATTEPTRIAGPRRVVHPTALFFAAAWCLLVAGGRARMFRDPGTFWHLVTGERIFAEGFPRADWLTFTFQGRPWIAHQWLAECAMAALHRLGGLDALLVATSGALALVFAWAFHQLVRGGVQAGWAAVTTGFGALAAVGQFHVRPLIVSVALFAVTYSMLVAVEHRRSRPPILWWLVPLFVVWANCHGAVLGGIATVALAGAAWIVLWALGRPSPVASAGDAVTVSMIVCACAASVLANPYGVELIRTWASILTSSQIATTVQEHASLVRARAWQVVPFGALFVLLFVTGGPARWSATNALPLVWLALTLERVRHAPFFAVAALVASAELVRHGGLAAWLARRGVHFLRSHAAPLPFPRVAPLAVPAALLLIVATHAYARTPSPLLARLDDSVWPLELLPDLHQAQRALGEGAPILNDTVFGGFVELHVPGFRVFSDDRFELFGDAFMAREATADAEWLEGWIRSHDVVVALAQRSSPLHDFLARSPAWCQLAASRPALLFARPPRPEWGEARAPDSSQVATPQGVAAPRRCPTGVLFTSSSR